MAGAVITFESNVASNSAGQDILNVGGTFSAVSGAIVYLADGFQVANPNLNVSGAAYFYEAIKVNE